MALLSNSYNTGDVRRRIREISTDPKLTGQVGELMKLDDTLSIDRWLTESRRLAARYVYAPKEIKHLQDAQETGSLKQLDLSEEYLKHVGRVSQKQALLAAKRLGKVWATSLTK